MSLPRCDRWFELDDGTELQRLGDSQHFQSLGELEALIYVLKPIPEMPASVLYPHEDVKKAIQAYFTNPLSYMIALAIYENFDRISVHGIQLTSSQDHEVKANIEYLLGVAIGRDIKIEVPRGSNLLKASKFYGYDRVSLYDHLWARVWRMDDEMYQLTKELDGLGERMELERNSDKEVSNNTLRLRQHDLRAKRAKLEGSMEECRYWMSWTNDTGFDYN